MPWTIEALNREHPLPEGWLWVMYEGDLIAMRRATDTRREFVCARDGELLADTIDTLNADAAAIAPPVDVALAVLLVNKAGGPATGAVARHYRDLLDASRAARDWVGRHGDDDLPLAGRALVEAARPLRISDMIDLLARDEARSLEWRRAELRKAVDAGGSDAEAAATELAEVIAPFGDR